MINPLEEKNEVIPMPTTPEIVRNKVPIEVINGALGEWNWRRSLPMRSRTLQVRKLRMYCISWRRGCLMKELLTSWTYMLS